MKPNPEFLKLQETWAKCTACEIGRWAHRHVFGEGLVPAQYLFVGEGPGVSEDALGVPFVGRSGRLLREALKQAGFNDTEWYITNLVACRPCDSPSSSNRAPTSHEILNCSIRLEAIVKAVSPRVLVAVGSLPAGWLSENFSGHRIRQIRHPAWILRQGGKAGAEYPDWLDTIKRLRELK